MRPWQHACARCLPRSPPLHCPTRPCPRAPALAGSIVQVADAARQGYDVVVFAYGPTGAGKTFTMMNMEPLPAAAAGAAAAGAAAAGAAAGGAEAGAPAADPKVGRCWRKGGCECCAARACLGQWPCRSPASRWHRPHRSERQPASVPPAGPGPLSTCLLLPCAPDRSLWPGVLGPGAPDDELPAGAGLRAGGGQGGAGAARGCWGAGGCCRRLRRHCCCKARRSS